MIWNRRTLLMMASAMAVSACAPSRTERPLTVFAAASLTDALTEIAALWEAVRGQAVRLSFASSGEVARQIEAGAPADVVIMADPVWMDRLAASGSIAPDSRGDLLLNRLVVIAPADAPVAADPFAALLTGEGRLVIGDPESVPAGTYARQMLRDLGLWERLQPRIVTAADVRAARGFVERGEAALGIVYRSDATGVAGVRVVLEPGSEVQPRIVYPVALTPDATETGAAFLAFLVTPAARDIFMRAGFGNA